MADNRQYSKKDISKILTKASEIQTRKDLYGDREGLTEEELISVAAEVGISRDALLEAMESYDLPSIDDKYNWLKANWRIQSIIKVPGRLSDDNWEDVVQEIRKVTGGIGKISKVGNTYEWEQRRKDVGYKHISFSPDREKTKIQLVSSWGPFRMMSTFVSCLVAFTITAIALDNSALSDVALFIAAVAGGAVGFPLSRIFLKSHYEKQKAQVEELVSSLSKKLGSSGNSAIKIEEEDVYSSETELDSSSPSGIRS